MNECIVCREVITNPVCVECIEMEIQTWLYEVKPELVEELNRVTDEINFKFGDTSCILCKEDMSVCTYCYIHHILTWLEKHPYLIGEFKRLFNFNPFFL
ncbi:MAG: hypothetical protein KJ583_07555 [Nanoarchaeota archaeon]|nr:hypothetical protein [Nanoarchaeota archaeon]MBU1270514.1 hypothetical protein [Nanoarchaeota archaeon]MBU1605143.1 hypothetical protein [Nanoarchaeota archaeon]MBU2442700.1 hypothetical protein [Nanoarchaeota archaeon]